MPPILPPPGSKASAHGEPNRSALTKNFIKFSELLSPRTLPERIQEWAEQPAHVGVSIRDHQRAGSDATARDPERQDSEARTIQEAEGGAEALVDPLELALCNPALGLANHPPEGAGGPRGVLSLDPLVTELVRAVAWGGDRRRGAARLELGGSRFGGTSVVVHAEGRELTLELDAPAHVDTEELAARLTQRLESRGLVVRSLTFK